MFPAPSFFLRLFPSLTRYTAVSQHPLETRILHLPVQVSWPSNSETNTDVISNLDFLI